MMLMSQAPKLLQVLQSNGSEEMLPNIYQSLKNGMDAGLMESRLGEFPMNLDAQYDPSINSGFPSDWATDSDLNSLVDRFSEGHLASETPALESAANMLVEDPNIGTTPEEVSSERIQELYDESVNSPTTIDGMEVSDEDMDELHQSEMWDNGYNYKRGSLTDWYKKHKRQT